MLTEILDMPFPHQRPGGCPYTEAVGRSEGQRGNAHSVMGETSSGPANQEEEEGEGERRRRKEGGAG